MASLIAQRSDLRLRYNRLLSEVPTIVS